MAAATFFDNVEILLNILMSKAISVTILGDFNINVMSMICAMLLVMAFPIP